MRDLEYNEDDVLVIRHLVDKCLSIRRFSNDFRTRTVRVDRNWAYIETILDHWLR